MRNTGQLFFNTPTLPFGQEQVGAFGGFTSVKPKHKPPLRFAIQNNNINLLAGRSGNANKVMQISDTQFSLSGAITGNDSSTTGTVGNAYNPTTKLLYVGTSNGIEVYDMTDQSLVTQIALTGGANYMVYVSSVNKLFVRNNTSSTINTIDCSTHTQGSDVTGTYTNGIAYVSTSDRVWSVDVTEGELVEINPNTLTATGTTVALSQYIKCLTYISETDQLYVGQGDLNSTGDTRIHVLDAAGSALADIAVTAALPLATSNILSFKYILGKIYASIAWSFAGIVTEGSIVIIDPSALNISDRINFTTSVYDCAYITSNDQLAVASFSGNAVYFIDAGTTYNSGYVETSFPYVSTSTVSTPFWLYKNEELAATSSAVTLFSATEALPGNVTVNMAGPVTYAQFVHAILGSPVALIKAEYFTASNINAFTGNINLNTQKNSGVSSVALVDLALDPYQNQPAKDNIDMQKFLLDGLNTITLNIPYGITATLMVQYEDANTLLVNQLKNECLL